MSLSCSRQQRELPSIIAQEDRHIFSLSLDPYSTIVLYSPFFCQPLFFSAIFFSVMSDAKNNTITGHHYTFLKQILL